MRRIPTAVFVLAVWMAVIITVASATVFTSTYDTSTPAGTDPPSVLDNRHRETKSAIQERENVDHVWPFTGTQVSDANVGEHRKITFSSPISKPTNGTDLGFLYTKNIDSVVELHWEDESGNEMILSTLGKIPFASLNNVLNDTAISAVDNAGTGTVDLIKADTNDVAVLVDDSQTETNAAPTFTKSLVNKKYVDDNVGAANYTPTSYAGEESITFPNGMIMKQGTGDFGSGGAQQTKVITFGAAFPTACTRVWASAFSTSGTIVGGYMEVKLFDTTTATFYTHNLFTRHFNWQAWGY